ncbi:MAG: ATP-binding protein [Ignavibacteriales bacterium]|nr:ATP-binding protein [Ignavibacteriales bacterium]
MKTRRQKIFASFRKYHFEIRHLTVLFMVLIVFQVIVSFVHKLSTQKFLVKTQEWYQQDSAERLANLTTTSLELLLEAKSPGQIATETDVRRIVQDFNIIFSQQLLHQNVQEICLLVANDSSISAIDDGRVLYLYAFENLKHIPPPQMDHSAALALYREIKDSLSTSEHIKTIVEGKQTFHVFVPFVPRGEYVGAMYMRNTPDFSFMTREMISSYDEIAITYAALILFGLLAMYYISSYTVKERNETQALLFEEQTRHMAEQIKHQNEMMFTKRIYHTHHKAEKVMGFIKEDARNLSAGTIEAIKYRIEKYSNFIARVIYDMKWYDPPLQTVRSSMFRTNVNDVIEFLVKNVFLRVSSSSSEFEFVTDLDTSVPIVPINEYVVWEVLEPLMQNAIEHAGTQHVVIIVRTQYDPVLCQSTIRIEDNGKGLEPWLLESEGHGMKKIFQEHSSTKAVTMKKHSGYGCYIAYEITTQRCGWKMDAENLPSGGCVFTITIPHGNGS